MAKFIEQLVVAGGLVAAPPVAKNVDSPDMVPTGAAAGSYGDGTHTLTVSVDTAGRITSVASQPINTTALGVALLASNNVFTGTNTITAPAGTNPPSPLILKGTSPSLNPTLVLMAGVTGHADMAFAQPTGNVQTFFANGTLFTQTGVVSSGFVSASVDSSGNNFSVANFGLDKLNGIPTMITTVSDVGGPNIAHELSTAAGSFFQLGIDTNGNWIHSIEANGSILWGVGSTHASMDVGLKRIGAGILGVRNGQPDNAFSLLQAADFAVAYVSKTAAYTLTASDSIVAANATTAAFAVTLPAANSVPAGRSYTVKKTDSSANAVTLTAAGTDKIDGAATYALSAQNKYVRVISDGSANWNVVANN